MSAEQPGMRDIRPRPGAGAAEPESAAVEPDPSAGAWPEQMGDINFYADTSLTIPGQSEPPGECGQWGPREYCKGCGDVKLGPQRCQRRLCRTCWETWRGNRAAAITERLAGARRAADGREKRGTHTVVSPPEGSIQTLNEFEQGKRRAYELAREKGIRGGVMIPHGWRILDEVKEVYRALKAEGEIGDIGIWRWVREHNRDWRSLTYWSPHYHVIGVGYDVGRSDPENDDGWVFSRLSNLQKFKLNDAETYEPMNRLASYLLSHGAYEPDAGSQMVRWFGELANNQFSAEADLEDWERSVIERNTQKAAGYSVEREDGKRECDVEGCTGGLAPIWSAFDHLSDPQWCQRLSDNQEATLAAAFEWSIGDLRPPPGLKFPSTETEAKEAWGNVLGQAGVDP